MHRSRPAIAPRQRLIQTRPCHAPRSAPRSARGSPRIRSSMPGGVRALARRAAPRPEAVGPGSGWLDEGSLPRSEAASNAKSMGPIGAIYRAARSHQAGRDPLCDGEGRLRPSRGSPATPAPRTRGSRRAPRSPHTGASRASSRRPTAYQGTTPVQGSTRIQHPAVQAFRNASTSSVLTLPSPLKSAFGSPAAQSLRKSSTSIVLIAQSAL